MLMFLLEMDGFGVMTADSVGEALRLARDTQFDIYILDQNLRMATARSFAAFCASSTRTRQCFITARWLASAFAKVH